MKRTIASLVVFACMLVVALVPNAQARHECSNATLQGSYGWSANGAGGRETTPGHAVLFVAVGIFIFDGNGNVSDPVETVRSQDRGIRRLTDHGTYTVNRDCTGSAQFSPEGGSATFDFVIVDGGKEVLLIDTRPRVEGDPFYSVVVWVAKKQFPRDHDDEED